MNDQQLKIRIKLNQIPQSPMSAITDHPEINQNHDEEKLPFDWFKISAAILLLITLIVFSYWLLTSGEKESNEDMNQLTNRNQESSDFKPAVDEVSPEAISTVPIFNDSDKQAGTVQNHTNSEIINNKTIISSKNNAKQVMIIPSSKPEPKELKLSNPQSKEKSTHARLSSVIKAQLTTSPQKQESINSIDRIELQRGTNQTVYYFLHIRNLKGEKIFVNWYYQDKQIAKIPFSINTDNWHAHSSKILTKTRLGRWRVTTMDQLGNILSEQSFLVSSRS